tara:strand:+ start:298 stop:480 length:183 start_codon:yes stop_codon:yes gene_type:complete
MKNRQKILPFIHKDTKEIINKGNIKLKLNKYTYLIEYKNKKFICKVDDEGIIESCNYLWS